MAFKLSAITWSHHYSFETGRLNGMKSIGLYSKLGLGGVEFIYEHIRNHSKKHLLELKNHAAEKGLCVTAISPGNSFGCETQKEENAQINYVKRAVDTACTLNCGNVRVFAGWPHKNTKKYWSRAVCSMKKCASYAGEKGVTLMVEPHNNGGLLPDSASSIRFLKNVDSPWVKLNLDTGNFLGHDRDIYKAIEKTVKYAGYCHIKIHKITKTGKTADFDLEKIIRILALKGYNGWLSVEYEGQEFLKGNKKEKAANEREYFKIAADKLKTLIKKYY